MDKVVEKSAPFFAWTRGNAALDVFFDPNTSENLVQTLKEARFFGALTPSPTDFLDDCPLDSRNPSGELSGPQVVFLRVNTFVQHNVIFKCPKVAFLFDGLHACVTLDSHQTALFPEQTRRDLIPRTRLFCFLFCFFPVVIVVRVQMTRHFFVENVRKFLDQLP